MGSSLEWPSAVFFATQAWVRSSTRMQVMTDQMQRGVGLPVSATVEPVALGRA